MLPPREVDELTVGAGTVDDRITIGEVIIEFTESGNLGRADKGEILRPEEDDLPFPCVCSIGNVRKCSLRIG